MSSRKATPTELHDITKEIVIRINRANGMMLISMTPPPRAAIYALGLGGCAAMTSGGACTSSMSTPSPLRGSSTEPWGGVNGWKQVSEKGSGKQGRGGVNTARS